MNSNSNQNEAMTPAEEAAWFTLSPYINPIDCSEWRVYQDEDRDVFNGPIPHNRNAQLNAAMNKDRMMNTDGEFTAVRLNSLGRKGVIPHFRGRAKLYYRSSYKAVPRIGYGSHERAHERLGFDASVFIADRKAQSFPKLGLMLVGIDIDAHNGERDVCNVRDWLEQFYFPKAYSEASTHGTGCHIYLKVYYNREVRPVEVSSTLKALFTKFDEARVRAGYDAPIDVPCGLPTQVGYVKDSDGEDRLQVTRRSQCMKIPFRGNCTMDRVIAFAQAPYFAFTYLESLLAEPLPILPHLDEPDGLDLMENDEADKRQTAPRDTLTKYNGESCVPPSSVEGSQRSLERTVEEIRAYAESHIRRFEFAAAYTRFLGRIATPEEYQAAYNVHGLASGRTDNDAAGQLGQFRKIARYLSKTYDPAKVGRDFSGYDAHRYHYEQAIRDRLTDLPTFSKGKGKIREVSVEKLAAALFVFGKLAGPRLETCLGYESLMKGLKALGHGCTRNAASAIIKAFEGTFIVKTAKYAVGHHSNRWAIVWEPSIA